MKNESGKGRIAPSFLIAAAESLCRRLPATSWIIFSSFRKLAKFGIGFAAIAAMILAGCSKGGASGDSRTYNLSGTVSGAVSQNVSVTLSGAGNASTHTDASGNYSFTGLANGSYTATPTLAGYTFSPSSIAVTISGANVSGTNFSATANVAPTYTLSGTVTGATLQNVLITLSGAGNATTQTDASGNYSFTGLANGSYTVTPSLTGYTFSPTSTDVSISDADATAGNFVSTAVPAPTYSISGAVNGSTYAGVTLTLTGDATATATSDAGGNFNFAGLFNGSYTVTPSMTGYTFSPSSIAVTISGANVSGSDFYGRRRCSADLHPFRHNNGSGGTERADNLERRRKRDYSD